MSTGLEESMFQAAHQAPAAYPQLPGGMDFVSDTLFDGRRLRALTIVEDGWRAVVLANRVLFRGRATPCWP
jgi:hypothetical protein